MCVEVRLRPLNLRQALTQEQLENVKKGLKGLAGPPVKPGRRGRKKVSSSSSSKEENKENRTSPKKVENKKKENPRKRKKIVSSDEDYDPLKDPRYYCPSCCCFVDASQRRHDQLVHMPARTGRALQVFRQEWKYPCDLCPKRFYTESVLNQHIRRMHEKESFVGKTAATAAAATKVPKKKKKAILFCYDCSNNIPRKDYIDHLVKHDLDRRDAGLNVDSVNIKPSVKKGSYFRTLDSLRDEYFNRKYIYSDPSDPQWNGEDAVLQCRHCPFHLFSTWDSYEKHVKTLHPYVHSENYSPKTHSF